MSLSIYGENMRIAIASGKGGTGKTTLSTNITALSAESTETVLVDLDVEEPNSGLFFESELQHFEDMFKMIPEWKEDMCILCDICRNSCNFHAIIKISNQIMVFPQLCHACYACSELCPKDALPMIPKKMGELRHYKNSKLDFIESRLVVGEEQAVPLISQTKEYIDSHFNRSIIRFYDCPPGTSCPVIEAVKSADFVILVTEPTPFGLYDLTLAVDTMRELKMNFAVVLNRYGIGNDDVLNYCEAEGIPVIAKIANSKRIAELYSGGELIYNHIPDVRLQLQKILDYINKIQITGDAS